ncbi:MAG: hypothetical protein KKF33_17160 [Alphaproteobacteria bacterium]|nr:hypothetical protein [Alphaproteobacteria bacterium]
MNLSDCRGMVDLTPEGCATRPAAFDLFHEMLWCGGNPVAARAMMPSHLCLAAYIRFTIPAKTRAERADTAAIKAAFVGIQRELYSDQAVAHSCDRGDLVAPKP